MSKPDPDPVSPPDPAVARFWMLNLMRLGGLMMVVGALVILSGRLPAPPILGYGLLIAGVFEFFFLPRMIGKRWKSPEE